MFKALADPTRRLLLDLLFERDGRTLTELGSHVAMSRIGVMKHLGVLEAAGLVRSEKLGRVRTCAIETQALSLAEQWINARRTEWEHRLDRVGDYLKTLEQEGDGDDSGD